MTRLIAFVVAASVAIPALAERRAALLVGENAGDADDAALTFAESDAARMREVLVDVGGFAAGDTTLLRGATAPDLRAALAALSARLDREQWGKTDRLIVYVSSHAGGGDLHLRGTRFALADLRRFVEASPVGIALLVLDTCEAGAATRAKGLVPLEGRVVDVELPRVTGRVVIASAGPGQSAFESEAAGGSFFTQHFIAGLRGAADASRDGRVTLQEAYGYAYTRTVDSTATVRTARQTPVFEMDLAGEGELVLSEPAAGRSRLTLDLARPGEWVVASVDGGTQVARFVKGAGPVTFAIEPGTYRIRSRVGDSYLEGTITLTDGSQPVVTDDDLSRWSVVAAGRKGSGPETSVLAAVGAGAGAVGGLDLLTGGGLTLRYAFDADPGAGRPFVATAISHLVGGPADASFVEREVGLDVGGGWSTFVGALCLRVTLQAGALLVRQESAQTRTGVQPRVGAQIGAAWRFAQDWSVEFAVTGATLLVRTEQGTHLRGVAGAFAGIGLRL